MLVGSLAAAWAFRDVLAERGVNTKDADVLVTPAGALPEAAAVAQRLLAEGWVRAKQCVPRSSAEPSDELEAIRLHPPHTDSYFVELLGVPLTDQSEARMWHAFELDDGWYGLPTFRFMGLATHAPELLPSGLRTAHPAMMALANLLSHPSLGTQRMGTRKPTGVFGGEVTDGKLRSAKDLGRVLALARLTPYDALCGSRGGAGAAGLRPAVAVGPRPQAARGDRTPARDRGRRADRSLGSR